MKEIRLITSEGNILTDFSDLKQLEYDLNFTKNLSEVEQLLAKLNHMIQWRGLASDQKAMLKRLRQKTYDRRKIFRLTSPVENSLKIDPIPNSPILQTAEIKLTPNEPPTFKEGVLSVLKNINGESFTRSLPAFTLFGIFAVLTIYLLWQQSVSLYAANGFSDPSWVAFGAIVMMVGFSAFHAVSKSKIALLLCLYASGYEIIFIVSGTFKDEAIVHKQNIENEPQLVWLRENLNRASANYEMIKSRYENPSSKVYQNSWYKEKHLDPAWQEYSAVQDNFTAKKEQLLAQFSELNMTSILKSLYRLGLVFLCMMSVHGLIRRARTN